jgi:hypothetical protein
MPRRLDPGYGGAVTQVALRQARPEAGRSHVMHPAAEVALLSEAVCSTPCCDPALRVRNLQLCPPPSRAPADPSHSQ